MLGEVNTFGSPVPDPWLWLESTIDKGATSACVQPSSGNVTWPAGSEVAFGPTEYDKPNSDVESRFLSSPAAWDGGRQCWLLQWTQGLSNRRFAGDVPIGDNNHVSLRALIARVDWTVVFQSVTIDGDNFYGGGFEIFDVTSITPARIGRVTMKNTRLSIW